MASKLKMHLLLTAVIFGQFKCGASLLIAPKIEYNPIVNASLLIVKTFYAKNTPHFSLFRAAFNESAYAYQSVLISALLHAAEKSISVSIYDYSFTKIPKTVVASHWNWFVVNDYDSFKKIFENMDAKTFKYSGFFTIVITQTFRNQYEIITKILEDCWSHHIINIVVLVDLHIQDKCAIYTYYPFTRFHCSVVKPVITNYVVNNSLQYPENNLFTRKTKNFHKCPITVVTFQDPPHIILTDTHNGSYYMDGIDGIILRVLSQRLNFTPIVIIPSDGQKKGVNYKNGTITGAMKLIVDGKANITAGAYGYNTERVEVMHPTFPYLYMPVILILSPGQPYTAIEKLFLPFTTILWSIIGLTFLISFTVILSLKFTRNSIEKFVIGTKNEIPILNTFSAFLGGYVTPVPNRNFARTLFAIWMLGSLVIRNAYQGELYNILKSPIRMPGPHKLNDLIDLNCTIFLRPTSFYLLEHISSLHKLINFGLDPYEINYLVNATKCELLLTGIIKLTYFNMLHFKEDIFLHALDERISLLPFSMYLPKHSYLIPVVNNQILAYTSNGLIELWTKRTVPPEYFNSKIMQPIYTVSSPLSMKEVLGIFQICACLYGIAIGIFFIEILSTKVNRIRRQLCSSN